MATYNVGYDKTYKAGMANLGDYQYRFVKVNSASKIINASTIGGSVIGVLMNDPVAVDEEAVVRVFGFAKVRSDTEGAASPVTVGGWVKCASTGMAMGTSAVEFSASAWAAGWSSEAVATGSGQWIEIFVKPMRFGA